MYRKVIDDKGLAPTSHKNQWLLVQSVSSWPKRKNNHNKTRQQTKM